MATQKWRVRLLPILLAVFLLLSAALLVGWVMYQQRVQVITIATASKGGEYYGFAQAFEQVVSRHQPRLKIRVIETKGSAENMELLQSRRVQLAIAQNDTPFQPAVQMVAALFPEVFHLVAAPSAQISSISELRGKRVALMPKGSGSYAFFWQLLQHYNLGERDVQAIARPLAQAQTLFRQGKVDALFRSIAPGNQGMRDFLQSTPTTLIALDQVASMQVAHPFLQAVEIPKGLYRGQPPLPAQDLPAAAVRALLLTHDQVAPQIIYDLTQMLYDYRNELAAINPRAAAISPVSDVASLGLPINPGAADYYNKTQPSFFERFADSIALLITLIGIVGSFVWQLHSRWVGKQKNRGDAYNLRVLNIGEAVANCQSLADLEEVRHELFDLFKQVVSDLDQDRLTPEVFQTFAVSWEVTINTIHHRELMLLNGTRSSKP
jgi:uncharacterized protein